MCFLNNESEIAGGISEVSAGKAVMLWKKHMSGILLLINILVSKLSFNFVT